MATANVNFLSRRFSIVKKWCEANGIVPQVSKIRVSQPLANGVGTYNFNIQQTNGKVNFIGEQLLNRNDVFIPFSLGVLLSFDDAEAPTGKSPLFSYAPKAGAANAYGFITDDIEALYNGAFIQTVDQTAIMQQYPAELFKYVPENVPAICLDSSNNQVSVGIQAQYKFEDALHVIVPNIIYQGTMDIKTSVQFNGTGSDFSIAAGSAPTTALTDKVAYLNFIMYGTLVKNGADSPSLSDLTNAFKSI